MSKRRRRRKHGQDSAAAGSTVELNLMPFIDIFSLLTTFLLFSAVFVHIGVLEVQVPFLTNAPPPKTKNTRSISVKVDLRDKDIEVSTEYSEPPTNAQTYTFQHDEKGLDEMHRKLVEIRKGSPENDKLTLFVEDQVTYERMTKALDAIKLLQAGEPPFPAVANSGDDEDEDKPKATQSAQESALYPKVVIGSVML